MEKATILTDEQRDKLGYGVAVYQKTWGDGKFYWQDVPHYPHSQLLCGLASDPFNTLQEAYEAAPKDDGWKAEHLEY